MLLRRSRQAIFESMVRAYSTDLYRWARSLCGDAILAEDLVQETFARAWKNMSALRNADAAKPWLFTILRREFARHCASKHQQTLSLSDEDWAAIPCDKTAIPHDLNQAVAKLPDNYRLPLVLQVLGGFDAAEIGAILDCSADAALQRISRARRQLRTALAEPAQQQYRAP
jgi:RNA polymerase sigma-70 factor (ECF subfamily)